MFARYAGIGVGHDAVQLRRHAHGLVQIDDHLASDSEEGDEASMEESPCEQASPENDGVLDDEEDEGDKGDEDGASSVSEGSEEDSDFEARF